MSVKSLMGMVNKKYGAGTMLMADDAHALTIDRLPFGVFDLDMKIGGGMPRGRFIMIKGGFSTSKTQLAIKGLVSAQSRCRFCNTPMHLYDAHGEYHEMDCACKKRVPMTCVWLDAEHSYDKLWMSKHGVDNAQVYVIQPTSAEQAVDVVTECIRDCSVDYLVVDSVASLPPIKEVESSAEQKSMGDFAKLMNQGLRKWISESNSQKLLATTKCTVVLINQMRKSLSMYGSPDTSPGGMGLDHFCSLVLMIKRKEWIESAAGERHVGISVDFSVVKNKTAPKAGGGEYSIYFVPVPGRYDVGDTDVVTQVLRLASYWGLIKKSGSWLYFPGDKKFQGIEKSAAYLWGEPEYVEELKRLVSEKELAWSQTGEIDASATDEEEEEA